MFTICRSFPSAVSLLVILCGAPAFCQPPERREEGGRPLTREELEKKYDRDGDGRLAPDERRAMIRDVVEGRVEVPPAVRENFRRLEARFGQRPGEGAAKPQPGPGVRPNPRVPDNVAVERDVVYGEAEGRPLKLDLVLPRPAPPRPCR